MDTSKQQLIAGKYIIGIDPAKTKHQAVLIDPSGLQIGTSFAFDVTYEGYTDTLSKKVTLLLPKCNPDNKVFAIETSCTDILFIWMVYLSAVVSTARGRGRHLAWLPSN